MPPTSSPESLVRAQWERLRALPLGKRLFSLLLGRLVPYTGSIRPRVEVLRPGHATVVLRDRRRVRNHLGSVHAVALANLAELSTGLALNYALPPDARSILKGLCVEYHRKARGTLTATCDAPVPESSEQREYALEAVIRDPAGEVVATARVRWLVGPRP
jgi:acyl-coenzyme A thioesterase PaaI-like protein